MSLDSLDTTTDRTPGAFLAPLPSHPRSSIKDEGFDLTLQNLTLPFPSTLSSSSPPSYMSSSVSPPLLVPNSVTAVSLSAAGMQPLFVNVSRPASPSSLLPNYPSHVSIHIKLSLSSLHDVSSTLHGFSGTVTFAAAWTSVAQCMTRLYAGGVCKSIEQEYFEPATPLSPVSLTPVTVPLPESELSRCRWGSIGECIFRQHATSTLTPVLAQVWKPASSSRLPSITRSSRASLMTSHGPQAGRQPPRS
jgi:hypothetical protein